VEGWEKRKERGDWVRPRPLSRNYILFFLSCLTLFSFLLFSFCSLPRCLPLPFLPLLVVPMACGLGFSISSLAHTSQQGDVVKLRYGVYITYHISSCEVVLFDHTPILSLEVLTEGIFIPFTLFLSAGP
jgi:hypothetical protein